MKFKVTKSTIVDIIGRAHDVATRGARTDFSRAGILTFSCQPDLLSISASNGYLEAIFAIDKSLDDELCIEDSKGYVTTDSGVLLEVLKNIGGPDSSDHTLQLSNESNGPLVIQDVSVKRCKVAKIQTKTVHHNISFNQPKSGGSYSFDWGLVESAAASLSKYISVEGYKPKFQMMCVHILPSELRFICGDGVRFGVVSHSENIEYDVKDDGYKLLIPVIQLGILCKALKGCDRAVIKTKSNKEIFVQPENSTSVRLHLKGIPDVQYTAYEKHAYRMDEASVIIDMETADLVEAVNLTGAVYDKELDVEGRFHTVNMKFGTKNELNATVSEGKYRCDFTCPAVFHKITGDDTFTAAYAWSILNDISKAATCDTVRFYGISPKDAMIVEIADTGEGIGLGGAPELQRPTDKPRTIFFFVPAPNTGGSKSSNE